MNNSMYEKKQSTFKSPDLNKLQEVIIDLRTKIYIAQDADPEEARKRYLSRFDKKIWSFMIQNAYSDVNAGTLFPSEKRINTENMIIFNMSIFLLLLFI